jgi:integrase
MLFRVYSRYVPNLTRNDGSAFNRLILSSFPTTVNRSGDNKGDDNLNDEIAKESNSHDR